MSDAMTLPVTPSLRRLACAYLTGDAPPNANWWAPWRGWTMPKCYKCGALNQYRPPACLACGDTRTPWRVPALPLTVPAGLAIARMRLGEVLKCERPFDRVSIIGCDVVLSAAGWDRCHLLPVNAPDIIKDQPAAVAFALHHLDPELREVADADR